MKKVIEFLVSRAEKQYSPAARAVATALGGAFFIAGWPALIFWAGKLLGGTAGLLPCGWSRALAVFCFVFGVPWMGWAVFWQLSRGKGTPVPVVPTKNFLPTGPYRYVRNPMILGFLFYLLGWAFLFNQAGTFVCGALIALFFILEIKLIEEKELERRFGDAYREYRKKTPFFLPRR